MKKLLVVALMGVLYAGTAGAKDSTGCGFGSVIFDGHSGVVPQILAVTTNGSTGSQTFGISSGTLGCDQNGTVSSSVKLAMFTGSNMERLAQDMSQGHGEALATMADLMGIQDQDKAEFYTLTQKNFAKIFPDDNTTAAHVITTVKTQMSQDTQLAKYVS
jgi:hypothetical protein